MVNMSNRYSKKYIIVNSSDLVSGNTSSFSCELYQGIKIRSVKLISLLLPNTITSPIFPTYINIVMYPLFERNVVSTNSNKSTFTIPFIPGQVTTFNEDYYNQEFTFDTPIFISQFNVDLRDQTGSLVTFSSGDWSMVLEVKYE